MRALLDQGQKKTARLSVVHGEPVEGVGGVLGEAASLIPAGIEFGALVEVETFYSHAHSEDESDLTLATVELSGGAQFSDWIRGDLVMLYEEDATEPMDIDQGFLTFGNTEEFPLYLQAGRLYMPFGFFNSFFISDPVVLELGETLESGAVLGFEEGGVSSGLAVFNGDLPTDGENQIDNLVASVSYRIEKGGDSFHLGGAWIRNIMDSDGLSGVLEDSFLTPGDEVSDDIGGVNLWATLTVGRTTFIAEYVAALDEFRVNGVKHEYKPASLNLEAGCAMSDRMDVAVKYEKSDDVADWFAENRAGVVYGYLLSETELYSASLALEYMKEDFGAGAEDADVATLQLAVEF